MYFAGRFYCPALGRWMSRDPAGEDAGANLYVFCRNAPTWLYDVLGRFSAEEAVHWYFHGNGQPREMPFSEVDTSGLWPSSFDSVAALLDSCTPSSTPYQINDSKTIHGYGATAFILGDMSINLAGTLTIQEGGGWWFYGTLKCPPQDFSFTWKGNNFGRDVFTVVTAFLFLDGMGGKPYTITVSGEKITSQSGNCCW